MVEFEEPDGLNRIASGIFVARCIATIFQTAHNESGLRTVSILWSQPHVGKSCMEDDGLFI